MTKRHNNAGAGVTRRNLLKAAGALAGAGAVSSFPAPAVWSAEEKVLRYLGTAVNQSDDITKKVKADTGITIQNIVATTDDVTKRVATQPNSFDILDTEYFSLKKLVPSGNILAMDAKKIKEFDNITPIFTKGQLPNGKVIGDQGTAPKKVMFLEGQHSKTFSKTPTEWVTLIPTVYNADTLGIRPDLIKRPIEHWSELLNPEFKGKAAILNIPVDRHHGRRDGRRVAGQVQVSRQGQHDEGRDRHDGRRAHRSQEGRPVPRLLEGLQRERQPDGVGRDRHPVDVVAGGHRGAHQGHPLRVPAAEGRLSLLGVGLLHVEGRRRAKQQEWVYEFVNWYLSGWAGAYLNRQGYYSAVLSTAKANMEPYEWAYWMEGKPAEKDIHGPDGSLLEKAGATRDGGSYDDRMGNVACWNAVMDENDYMVRKWNEFIAA